MVDTNYHRARKFKGGLGGITKGRDDVLRPSTYAGVLDRALIAKKGIDELEKSRKWQRKEQAFEPRKAQLNTTMKKPSTGESSTSNQSSNTPWVCSICRKNH